MTRRQATRRDFLRGIAAATGAAITVPYFTSSSFAQQESANDTLNVGAIGTSIYTDRYTGAGEHAGRGAVVGHQAGGARQYDRSRGRELAARTLLCQGV